MRKLWIIAAFMVSVTAKEQTVAFAAGCFWGVEKYFESLEGVKEAVSGYAGGAYKNPTYETVLAHRNDRILKNHAETVKVVYDDARISTRALMEHFWQMHDPTQGDRQGNDVGNNYRSAIFYTTPEQRRIALETKAEFQALLRKAGYGKITTEIAPLKRFYKAEAYHQDYLKKHPAGYCPNHATGVTFPKNVAKKETQQITPLGGKEIVVITAPHCRFCEAFEKDVVARYRGSVPLRTAIASALSGFRLSSDIQGTPTILFIKEGKERFRHVGYMGEKAFYKALGALKLGKESKAYDVAFNRSTDARFCRRYEKFAHTGDGVFVDTISGEALFDTRDRFDSGSGWLSFFQAIPGTVEFREDNSYGMHRIEVIAKKSGAHLGHVFDDAPGGRKRFCINATVLEFVPKEAWNNKNNVH